MRIIFSVLILALAVTLAPAGPECSSKKADAAAAQVAAHECGADCTKCTAKATEAIKLADGAEKGCQASMAALIAMAEKSGDANAASLASKAQGGCEHSKGELIALARTWSGKTAPAPDMAQLAVAAEGGCSKSMATLIQTAKASKDAKAAELAVAAEGGCEHSKAALVTLVKDTKAGAVQAVQTK